MWKKQRKGEVLVNELSQRKNETKDWNLQDERFEADGCADSIKQSSQNRKNEQDCLAFRTSTHNRL
jgi:hypothetical protein